MKTSRLLIIPLIIILMFCSKKHDYAFKMLDIKGLADSARIVTTGNISGSAKDELILGKDSSIYIYSVLKDSAVLKYKNSFSDNVLEMITGDADNDGADELIIVTGHQRYVETEVRVYILKNVDNKWTNTEIYSKHSIRPHPTYLDIADTNNDGNNEIIVSYFESKYIVETVVLSNESGQWLFEIDSQERMAMARDIGVLADTYSSNMVVGRVYGDALGDVGDAYISGDEKIMLPVKRGVKAVKIGDGNNNGENEIYVGDGWHQDYGKVARGRIAYLYFDGVEYKYELIEDVKYQYEISQIEIADITNNGKNEVLARGSRSFRIYNFDKEGWSVFTDTSITNTQFTVGDIYGDNHPEVIFSGNIVNIYSFANLQFSHKLDEEIVTEPKHPDSLLNKPAPELIVAKWYNGNFGRIKNNTGKVILLDYWATWCKPCIKMFPSLRKFQEKYGERGLQIIGLTRLDNRQTVEAIEEFIRKENFAYPIGLSEESHNNLLYGVGAIPHVVLIDKKGIVRFYKIGLGDEKILEKEIVRLLEE
ncbi:TlpA family protein disulfide reductase [Bacteroidota bacterium]